MDLTLKSKPPPSIKWVHLACPDKLAIGLPSVPVLRVATDIAAEKVMMNAHQSLLFGWPEKPRVVSIAELRKRVPLEDLAISDARQKRLSEVGEPYHHEFRLHMPDGSERWLKNRNERRLLRSCTIRQCNIWSLPASH